MKPWIERSGGVLLDIRALPSGKLDHDALRFASLVAESGLRIWQSLPVGPRDAYGNPFQPASAFAGDTELLIEPDTVDKADYAAFLDKHRDWLDGWALFVALKEEMPTLHWWQWPGPLRDREPAALAAARNRLASRFEQERRAQHQFDHAWNAFKQRVNELGLLLFGDVPLFVAHDSADVWSQPQLFEIDADGCCAASVGVPPDAFAADGQWWGYPPYRWSAMEQENWRWWKRRFEIQASRFDLVRLDHFRGFAAFWRIPQDAASAAQGAWTPGPGAAAIEAIKPVLHGARLVAEDLGVITDDVIALRKQLGIPGMRVLQFAFDGDAANPHLPQHHTTDTVCYTGTHDNDTTLGWWNTLAESQKEILQRALDNASPAMPAELLDCAWSSPAPLTVVPMQDLLGLGSEARTNRPGFAQGNWRWRFDWPDLPGDFAARLHDLLQRHGRVSQVGKKVA